MSDRSVSIGSTYKSKNVAPHCAQDENTCQFDGASQWVTHTGERLCGMGSHWAMLLDTQEY